MGMAEKKSNGFAVELRLLAAEWLLGLALRVAPDSRAKGNLAAAILWYIHGELECSGIMKYRADQRGSR